MVDLSTVSSSNRHIASAYPNGIVAVFVGATSGIGYYTLRQFAKHTSGTKVKVYFVGRSKEAGERISAECSKLNQNGEFIFLQGDVSLLKKVDEVCAVIKEKEAMINLLFLSAGTLAMNVETSEGLDLSMAITYYSRTRFTANLLPQLQNAAASSSLSRVVTVLAGTKEGKFFDNDISGKTVPLMSRRGHLTSMITLSLSHFASQAPGVSFVHSYPGPVKTGIGRDMKGPMMAVLKGIFIVFGPLVYIPEEESGERHLFLATSGMFGADGVVVDGKDTLTKGVMDGAKGSRVYSTTKTCDPANPKTVQLMEGLKKNGAEDKVWQHTTEVFNRITGTESL